jgi:hypothetical protein
MTFSKDSTSTIKGFQATPLERALEEIGHYLPIFCCTASVTLKVLTNQCPSQDTSLLPFLLYTQNGYIKVTSTFKAMRVILFVCCLFFSIASFSQSYQPVGIENAHWFISATSGNSPDCHAFVVRGDTMINSVHYYKMYYQDFANTYPLAPPYLLEEEYLWGVVRDDTLERRVYVIGFESYAYGYQCPAGEEQLLFDFSLSPGDTTAHCLSVGGPWIIDSVYTSTLFGADRKTLYSPEWFGAEILEGIGSEDGLFGALYQIISEDTYQLADYCIGSNEDCGIVSTARGLSNEAPSIKLFPNPVEEMLFLNTSTPLTPDALVLIFDQYGRLVDQRTYSEAEMGIPVQALPTGIYHLKIQGEASSKTLRFLKRAKF